MEEFKLVVAGGRDFEDMDRLVKVVCDFAETKGDVAVSIVTGMAEGADRLAYEFAKANKVQWYEFHPDWDNLGRRAGYVRNGQMADFADGLIAFWDGESRGTQNMIELMKLKGKQVHVELY